MLERRAALSRPNSGLTSWWASYLNRIYGKHFARWPPSPGMLVQPPTNDRHSWHPLRSRGPPRSEIDDRVKFVFPNGFSESSFAPRITQNYPRDECSSRSRGTAGSLRNLNSINRPWSWGQLRKRWRRNGSEENAMSREGGR